MSSEFCDTPPHIRRKRGRPRGFQTAEALEAAMRLFWAHGYAAASIDMLTREMRVPRASLYQGYGDKEGLFLAAVAHYADSRFAPLIGQLDGDGPLAADLGGFFEAVIRHATADPDTLGCLVSCVLADAAGANQVMQAELARRFDSVEQRIIDRIRRAQAAGDVDSAADARPLAGMLSAVARGLMLRARAGAGAAELGPVAALAIRAACALSGPPGQDTGQPPPDMTG